MFFTKIGTIIAWLLVLLGGFQLGFAIFVATQFESRESMVAASKRYLGTATSGEAIDRAIMMIAAGVVVGMLAEIAKNGRRY